MHLTLALQVQFWTVTYLPRLEPTDSLKIVNDSRNALPVTFYTRIPENEHPAYYADYLNYSQERGLPTSLPGSTMFGVYGNLSEFELQLNSSVPLAIEWEDQYIFHLVLDNGVLARFQMDFYTHHLHSLLLDTALLVTGQKWGCASFSQQFLACHVPALGKLVQYCYKPSSILEPDKTMAWFKSKSTAFEYFFPHPGKFKSQSFYPYIVFWSSSIVHIFKQVKAPNNQLQLSSVAELKYEEPVVFIHLTSLDTLYIGFQSAMKERANEFWLRGYQLHATFVEEMDASVQTFTLASSLSCSIASQPTLLQGRKSYAQGFELYLGTMTGHLYHFFVYLDVTLSWELRVQGLFEPWPLHVSLHPQGWLLAIVYPQGKVRLCDSSFQVFHLAYSTLCVETLDVLQWVSFQTPPVLVSWSPVGPSSHESLVIVFDRGPILVLHFPVIGQLPWTTYVHLLVSHHALDRLRLLLAHVSVFSSDSLALLYGLLTLYTPYLTRAHIQKDILKFLSRCSKLPQTAASISLLPIVRHLILSWIHLQQDLPALHAASVFECTDLVDRLRLCRPPSSSIVYLCHQLLNLPIPSPPPIPLNQLYEMYTHLGRTPAFGKSCKKYAVHLECKGELLRARAQWSKLHNDMESEKAQKRFLQLETYLRKASKPFK